MRYIASSLAKRLIGWNGDDISDCAPHAYADSDFAGCEKRTRSTTGSAVLIEGPHTRFPIAGCSNRQGCMSCSTPKAEMVACHTTHRNLFLPMFPIWDAIFPGGWHTFLHGDNQVMMRVIETGENPTMKTLKRCHGVDLSFLHEWLSCFASDGDGVNTNRYPCTMVDTDTEYMAADIYTKAITNDEKWKHACRLIDVVDKQRIVTSFQTCFDAAWVEQSPRPRGGKLLAVNDEEAEVRPSCGAPSTTCASQCGKKRAVVTFRPPLTARNVAKGGCLKNLRFANVYGGSFALARALSDNRILADGWDRRLSNAADFPQPRTVSDFELRLRSGYCGGVSFDFPCLTWSRAWRSSGKGPRPLRADGDGLFAQKELDAPGRRVVDERNKLLDVTLDLIQL